MKKITKHLSIAALSLPLLLTSFNGSKVSASANLPTNVNPAEQPAWGYFVDTYKNNNTANMTVNSNPTIGVLSEFNKLWAPGPTWDTGTKLNSAVLDANIQKVLDITSSRTSNQEEAAYFDERRGQSYSVIDGLGSLTDVYRENAGATTTISSVPTDAETVKYNDGGTDAGLTDSNLGNIVNLVKTLRGNFSSTTPAKNYYSYMRPFRWASPDIVVPSIRSSIDPDPSKNGGFPSGHTNAAYLASLAMAYAVPERYQEMLTRASELGNNRIVAGMHSTLDVIGGRVMATALAASILSDPANEGLKKAAYDEAQTKLLTQTGTAVDRFADYDKNKKDFTQRLTYGFDQINSTAKPMVVPKGAEVLLETRLPYLDSTQRRWVLATTGLPSGYPVLDDPEGWGRLNLFAAADGYGAFAQDVTVAMDASKGGYNAFDRWRNDISGTGKLNKEGTGTLVLQGQNTYTGGTVIDQGTLEGDSETAFGSGDVVNNGGTLEENVSGKLVIGGNYTQSSEGTLKLTLDHPNNVVDIEGKASINGTLLLDFSDNIVLDKEITLISYNKNQHRGKFTSVETVGLPSQYKVKVIYKSDEILLKVIKK
ncbi:acid phosphatase [Bacillus sp. USDA818B3_A]|uniref:acid phosphatase n=1 Tax=Bacillus sp. USDA818B3_A TaxID=2698834 RepID=UPI00136B6DDB|nr:phosphatase PAP2 family protein [Bacillus sp. USDA818B3_A]